MIEECVGYYDPLFFLRREVNCLDDLYPGRIESYTYKRGKDIARDDRLIFTVKYYFETIGEGRAKKVRHCTRMELLDLLIYQEQVSEENEKTV